VESGRREERKMVQRVKMCLSDPESRVY